MTARAGAEKSAREAKPKKKKPLENVPKPGAKPGLGPGLEEPQMPAQRQGAAVRAGAARPGHKDTDRRTGTQAHRDRHTGTRTARDTHTHPAPGPGAAPSAAPFPQRPWSR